MEDLLTSVANLGVTSRDNVQSEAIRLILHPQPRYPVPCKDNQTVNEYLECCKQNLEAELWAMFQHQTSTSAMLESVQIKVKNKSRIVGAWKDNMPLRLNELTWKVLILNGTMCLVTHLKDNEAVFVEGRKLRSKHSHAEKDSQIDVATAHILGYVRPYVKEYCAILRYIRGLDTPCQLLKDIACPKNRTAFSFSKRPLSHTVPYNLLQAQCISGLSSTVEGIQGPPGTGKSTTIFHVVNTAMPPEQFVAIVTCVQNKAVDALAEKFGANIAVLPFIAVGSPASMGDTAARFTLGEQVKRDPAVVLQGREAARSRAIHAALAAALRAREDARFPSDRPFRGRLRAEIAAGSRPGGDPPALEARLQLRDPWRRWWCAFVRRGAGAALVADIAAWRDGAEAASARLRGTAAAAEQRLLDGARAFLCTVDSVSALPLASLSAPRRRLIVVDEAGTVPEYKVPLLVSLGAEAVLAVGDQSQLSPFSHAAAPGGPPAAAAAAGLFQRLVRAVGGVPMLCEQYRMHPAACGLVSREFYAGRLRTAAATAAARLAEPRGGVRWVDYPDRQAEAPCRRRRHNPAEVALLADYFADGLPRALAAGQSVMVVTFYKEQLRRLMEAGERAGLVRRSAEQAAQEARRGGRGAASRFVHPGLRIVTVDAAQVTTRTCARPHRRPPCVRRGRAAGSAAFATRRFPVGFPAARTQRLQPALSSRPPAIYLRCNLPPPPRRAARPTSWS